MDEHELQDALRSFLEEASFMDDDDRADAGLPDELGGIEDVRTFHEDGVLTTDAGLVLKMADGSEFQLTIVRSR